MNVSVVFDSASKKFVGTLNGQVVVRSVGKAYVERRLQEMAGEKIDFAVAAAKTEVRGCVSLRDGAPVACRRVALGGRRAGGRVGIRDGSSRATSSACGASH